MTRIFIILGIVIFVLSFCYSWGMVSKAKKNKLHLVSELKITAITKGYMLLSGGKETYIDAAPEETILAYGWANYLCLAETGRIYFVDNDRMVHTKMPAKEFYNITHTEKFKKCITDTINDADKKINLSIIMVTFIAISSVITLYLILIISIQLTKWVINGFKPD